MAQTAIEWVRNPEGELGFTFNPWIGCEHVSPACDNCYAEVDAPARTRRAKGLETWGPHAERDRTSPANWRLPRRWDRLAADKGARPRVFCASQSDWLDNKVPIEWLVDLLDLIRGTVHLDWLLLTKRIGNWRQRLEQAHASATSQGNGELAQWIAKWLAGKAPAHVWLGATVVNQEEANRDIVKLLRTPAAVRFLSMEPLLGPVRLEDAVASPYEHHHGCPGIYNPLLGNWWPALGNAEEEYRGREEDLDKIDWVIAGGESGGKARPMHPDWVRSLRDQCAGAGIPFFFKQWGEWHTSAIQLSDGQAVFRQFTTFQHWVNKASTWVNGGVCLDRHGRELAIGADFMRARDEEAFPVTIMHRVGKRKAGRLLDGCQYDASPRSPIAA